MDNLENGTTNALVEGIDEGISLDFFVCYLNGIVEAKEYLFKTKEYVDGAAAQWYQHSLRILDEYEKNTD
jgi:hypothetical protein